MLFQADSSELLDAKAARTALANCSVGIYLDPLHMGSDL
jgi:hypothetical protein